MFVPVKVTVLSKHEKLAKEVATRLQEQGFGDTATAVGEPDGMRIRHHLGMASEDLERLECALQPHRLVAVPDASLPRGEALVVVELGSEVAAQEIRVEIAADASGFGTLLRERLGAEGFDVAEPVIRAVGTPQVLYGEDVGELERSVLRGCLERLGVEASFQAWPLEGVLIQAPDPELVRLPDRERFEVCICSDDADAAAELAGLLGTEGFARVEPRVGSEAEPLSEKMLVDAGPFAEDLDRACLLAGTHRLCQLHGVDDTLYPVQFVEETRLSTRATIHLPLARWRAGGLRPYAGADEARFDVRIVTNGGPSPVALKALLQEEGFRPPREEAVGDGRLGFLIDFGEAARTLHVKQAVERVVRAAMAEAGASPEFPLHTHDSHASESEIVVYFPTDGLKDGSLHEACSKSSPYALTLISEDAARLRPLVAELETWGWASVSVQTEETPHWPQLRYGGAPSLLLERISEFVLEKTGLRLSRTRDWPLHDNDLWLSLPVTSLPLATSHRPAPAAIDATPTHSLWMDDPDTEADVPPLIDRSADSMRFADLELPVQEGPRHPLAPDPAAFEHFCLDVHTAGTLHHVARSSLLAEPCLLEGGTSTSKTSGILYMAQLLNQPVVRVNLSGQTDTGELIGRYAPGGESTGTGWTWQDGLVVQAMRHGYWLLLDEINLAETQILERLNSVLEPQPSLVLTEHDNRVIGPGGEPVHERFRLFGTMNPAEYAGRSTLSPAYRNRWRGHLIVPQPGEGAYRQMLEQLVQGTSPRIRLEGRTYAPHAVTASAGNLTTVEGISYILDTLARFHASVEVAAGQARRGKLGEGRREGYIFTRRDLLSVIFYIAHCDPGASPPDVGRAVRQALQRYYLARIAPGEDRDVIVQLLDAAGIGPKAWHRLDAGSAPQAPER